MQEAKSIKIFFETDHERLDQLFVNYMRFKKDAYPRAREYFFQFMSGLKRHIFWEEEVVFPLFFRKIDVERPIRVMHLEHQRILQILEALAKKVFENDRNTETEEYRLLVLLGEHELNEEMILYPNMEANVTDEETQAVFQQIANGPPALAGIKDRGL